MRDTECSALSADPLIEVIAILSVSPVVAFEISDDPPRPRERVQVDEPAPLLILERPCV